MMSYDYGFDNGLFNNNVDCKFSRTHDSGRSRVRDPEHSWAQVPKLCVIIYPYLCYLAILVVG